MREFKYNVIDLISYVRDRPCLWDKTIENYKDRIERRSAWEEIFNNLEESYEDMTAEEKRITGDLIIKKWSNVRDSFMKSLRTRASQTFRKRYMYANYLDFLMKNLEKTNTDFNCESDSSQSVSMSIAPLSPSANTPETPSSTPEPFLEFPPTVFVSNISGIKEQSSSQSSQTFLRQKKKRREAGDNKKAILDEKKKSRNDIITRPDEKETMLLSFKPYIKDMNETEMMDLHMEILTSIRKIKDKRAGSSKSLVPAVVNSTQLTSTPNLKPAIIKINPQKTLTFTFPNSQKAVNKANSYYIEK